MMFFKKSKKWLNQVVTLIMIQNSKRMLVDKVVQVECLVLLEEWEEAKKAERKLVADVHLVLMLPQNKKKNLKVNVP